MLTPYQFAHNSPIVAIDLDGLEAKSTNEAAQKSFASKVEDEIIGLKDKAVEALKTEFPNQEEILNAFSAGFDDVVENTFNGDFDVEASLKVSTGIRFAHKNKIVSPVPSFILGKSIDFNVGSIELFELKKIGKVNIFNPSSFESEDATFSHVCLLYTSPSPRDATLSRMPSSA